MKSNWSKSPQSSRVVSGSIPCLSATSNKRVPGYGTKNENSISMCSNRSCSPYTQIILWMASSVLFISSRVSIPGIPTIKEERTSISCLMHLRVQISICSTFAPLFMASRATWLPLSVPMNTSQTPAFRARASISSSSLDSCSILALTLVRRRPRSLSISRRQSSFIRPTFKKKSLSRIMNVSML